MKNTNSLVQIVKKGGILIERTNQRSNERKSGADCEW